MNLHRNEDGTLVNEDESFYVRKYSEEGFSESDMIAIENIRRRTPRGIHMTTEDALYFARQILNEIKG